MRIIVIGAGEVGFEIARILSREQNDVVVIDVDEGAIEHVKEKLDALTIKGNATSATVLEQADIRRAGMLIAVTAIDEVNLIACMMASRLGVPTTIARVRSDEFVHEGSILRAHDLGINMIIHPEESAAEEIGRLIRRAGASDVLSFCEDRLQLVGMRVHGASALIGKSMVEISKDHGDHPFRVMSIIRGVRTIMPTGADVIRENDQVFVLAASRDMRYVVRAMGHDDRRFRNVMILGGSRVGARVAEELAGLGDLHIKLIDPDPIRCEELAGRLPGVLVLRGSGTDIDLLAQEGLSEMDAFVAVTDDEESNLVTCLLAKHLGVRKTVALLSKGAYIPISNTIGLDAAVSTKLAVSREVMRFLRGKHVLSVATVLGLDAEILELTVDERSPITAKPLSNLKMPKGMLVGARLHDDHLEVATGKTHIEAGDRMVMFVLPHLTDEAIRLVTQK